MTESLEMYLETIGLLRDRTGKARVTDIAGELGVSKPSVHAALHELERRGLIEHEHYGDVLLSPAGKAASAEIRRKHELLTAFLRDIVGVGPETAERDACRIEHYLSAETMDRIAEIAGASTKRKKTR
jgi:DtxR family Mn-dependent transcriptional regulator